MIRLRHDVSVFPETWHLGPSERSRAGARRRDSSPSARRPRGSGDPEFGDPSRGRGGPLSQDLPGAGPPHPRGPDALPRGSGKRFLRAASLRGVPGAPGRRSRCSGHRRLGDRSRHPGLPARGRRRRARGTKPRRWAARPEPRAAVVWTRPHPTPPHRPPYLGGEPDTRPGPRSATRPFPRGPVCARGGAGRVGEVAGVASSTRGRSASGSRDYPSPRAQRLWWREAPHLPPGPLGPPPPRPRRPAQPSPPPTISPAKAPTSAPGRRASAAAPTSPPTLPHPLPPPYLAIAYCPFFLGRPQLINSENSASFE
ncbi:basic salivary proline-rich protein 4-like [Bos mutus]|uniref:basic salivary proline-rich protein 4-like n=1 Tax=Bos mutus TaxID=72004 RepID=UPI0038B66260